MSQKKFNNIKYIDFSKLEKSFFSPSSLLSELREFCLEIAAKTGYTEEESKKRVAYTVMRVIYYLQYLYKNLPIDSEELEKYSKNIAIFTDIIENEWGLIPKIMQKGIKEAVQLLNLSLNQIKPIKSSLSFQNRISLIFNSSARNKINELQESIDRNKKSIKELISAIERAESKPLHLITKYNIEEYNNIYSKSNKYFLEIFYKQSEAQKNKLSKYYIQQIFDYVEEIDPNNEEIQSLREELNLADRQKIDSSDSAMDLLDSVQYLTISEAQQRLPELSAQLIDQPAIITQDGKPVMVAFGLEQLESLMETIEIITDEEFMSDLKQGIKEAEAGDTISLEDLKSRF